MSVESLRKAVAEAQDTLAKLPTAMKTSASGRKTHLHIGVRAKLTRAQSLLEYRSACWTALENVRDHSNSDRNVAFLNEREIGFHHARHMVIQAYLGTTWSVTDVLVGAAAVMLGTQNMARDESYNGAKLLRDFLNPGAKGGPFLFLRGLRDRFLWPAQLSYHLRNMFMHEGGRMGDKEFFVGRTVYDGFRISPESGDALYEAVANRIRDNSRRDNDDEHQGASFFDSIHEAVDPRTREAQKLDVMLAATEDCIDEALAVLVITGAGLLLAAMHGI